MARIVTLECEQLGEEIFRIWLTDRSEAGITTQCISDTRGLTDTNVMKIIQGFLDKKLLICDVIQSNGQYAFMGPKLAEMLEARNIEHHFATTRGNSKDNY